MDLKFIIKRYEDFSDYRIIAFDIINKSGGKKYLETTVLLKDCIGKSDNEICCMAYEKLLPKILIEQNSVSEKITPVIGSEFIPPNIEQEYEFNI